MIEIEHPCPVCGLTIPVTADDSIAKIDLSELTAHVESHEPEVHEPLAVRAEFGANFDDDGVTDVIGVRVLVEGEPVRLYTFTLNDAAGLIEQLSSALVVALSDGRPTITQEHR